MLIFVFFTSSSTLDPTSEFAKAYKLLLTLGDGLRVHLKSQHKHSTFLGRESNLLDGQSFKTTIKLASVLWSRASHFFKDKTQDDKDISCWNRLFPNVSLGPKGVL